MHAGWPRHGSRRFLARGGGRARRRGRSRRPGRVRRLAHGRAGRQAPHHTGRSSAALRDTIDGQSVARRAARALDAAESARRLRGRSVRGRTVGAARHSRRAQRGRLRRRDRRRARAGLSRRGIELANRPIRSVRRRPGSPVRRRILSVPRRSALGLRGDDRVGGAFSLSRRRSEGVRRAPGRRARNCRAAGPTGRATSRFRPTTRRCSSRSVRRATTPTA